MAGSLLFTFQGDHVTPVIIGGQSRFQAGSVGAGFPAITAWVMELYEVLHGLL